MSLVRKLCRRFSYTVFTFYISPSKIFRCIEHNNRISSSTTTKIRTLRSPPISSKGNYSFFSFLKAEVALGKHKTTVTILQNRREVPAIAKLISNGHMDIFEIQKCKHKHTYDNRRYAWAATVPLISALTIQTMQSNLKQIY